MLQLPAYGNCDVTVHVCVNSNIETGLLKVPVNVARIFSFKSINDISLLADNLYHIYTSENTLYKNDKTGTDGKMKEEVSC